MTTLHYDVPIKAGWPGVVGNIIRCEGVKVGIFDRENVHFTRDVSVEELIEIADKLKKFYFIEGE